MARLLIVDDDLSLRQFLTIFLRKEGHDIDVAANGVDALAKLEEHRFDLVITDIRMPRMGGLELLDAMAERGVDVQVIVMTAFSTTETALDAMRKGAYDYIVKPFKLDEVRVVVDKCLEKGQLVDENKQLKQALAARSNDRHPQLIYRSDVMAEVVSMISRVAATPSSVLVLGESGTGKELVARMLHRESARAEHPFVAINCGAIPEQLMESELFGHIKGSFTGATKDKKGLFEAADGGTIFLDEIGELSLSLQVKLLRVLQERVITPVGAVDEIDIDVRVVAATHQDLRQRVADGRFRADLYYRLNVIGLRLPPLRERPEDVMPLATHFLARMNERLGRDLRGFEPEAEALLEALPFHGNVRELENIIERAVALETGEAVATTWLPDPGAPSMLDPAGGPSTSTGAMVGDPQTLIKRCANGIDRWMRRGEQPIELEALTARLERALIELALDQTGGNKTEAAQRLGVSFRSLRYKLAKARESGETSAVDEAD